MMELSTMVCDQCGKQRASDTNHWLAGYAGPVSIVISPLDLFSRAATVATEFEDVFSWPAATEVAHLCGEQCAVIWFAAKLGGLNHG